MASLSVTKLIPDPPFPALCARFDRWVSRCSYEIWGMLPHEGTGQNLTIPIHLTAQGSKHTAPAAAGKPCWKPQ